MTPGRHALVFVGLLALALGTAQPAHAVKVLVSNSTRFVDPHQGSGYPPGSQESDNVGSASDARTYGEHHRGPRRPSGHVQLRQQPAGDHPRHGQRVLGRSGPDRLFLIPEQESFCYLPGELLNDHPDIAAVWRNWVAQDGGLVIHSSNEARLKVDDLFFVVFNFRIPGHVDGTGITTTKKPAAAATQFAGGASDTGG